MINNNIILQLSVVFCQRKAVYGIKETKEERIRKQLWMNLLQKKERK